MSAVHYPGTDGQPSEDPAITLSYTVDGQVATRTDARGIMLSHAYDALGRRVHTDVDDSPWYDANSAASQSAPPNRISGIDYAYDAAGRSTRVTARTASGFSNIVAVNEFTYDDFGNLTREVQQHGMQPSAYSPAVDYAWSFLGSGDGNHIRLAEILYPVRNAASDRRAIQFRYDGGDVDDALGRVTGIEETTLGNLVNYQYMGTSRRVALLLACGIAQMFGSGGEYPGLDAFGRVLDLHFKDVNSSTVHRYQYGYDLAGNRTHCRITQVEVVSASHVNDRSWLYAYDPLSRLVDARMGQLDDANTSLNSGGPTPQEIHWYLDNLGNWSGSDYDANNNLLGGRTWTQGDERRVDLHAVNPANQVTEIATDINTAGPENVTYIHDPAGNLVWDGTYYYQYDAFNRLLSVREKSDATLDEQTGQIVDGELGTTISRYIHDGLGRLIVKVTPEHEGWGTLQTKRYYYDGIRRIAEVLTRHDESIAVDENDELPAEFVDADTDGTPDDIGFGEATWTDREYVYGVGDVDEHVCQIDRDDNVLFMLQDANLNVVAIVSEANTSGGGGPSTPTSGTVLEQYTWDPYGQLLAHDILDADGNGQPQHALNRVGFQGLFFDRLNGTSEDLPLAVNTPESLVRGHYYARNRHYSPTLGRWMQRDPNETAMPVITALAMNGENALSPFGGFDLEAHYGDGMNTYQFVSGNPITRRDSLGMDDFDDAIADNNGWRASVAGYIREGSGWALFGLNTLADAYEAAFSAVVGVDFRRAAAILGGQGTSSDLLQVGMALGSFIVPGGPAAREALALERAGARSVAWGRRMARSARGAGYKAGMAVVETADWVWHHTVPVQVLKELHPSVRTALEKLTGPHSIIWRIPQSFHKLLHGALGNGYRWSRGAMNPRGGGWNARWRAELYALGKRLRDVTKEEVLEIRERIVRNYEMGEFRPH